MNIKKKVIFVFIYLILGSVAIAQELNCAVTLNYNQINSKGGISFDKAQFAEIENTIKNFMNNQRWTTDAFAEKEKIKCNLVINLLESPGQNKFKGNAQFQVLRPVFGSTYETISLKYIDRNFDFSFAPEDRQMIFNEQSFTNNLTSILSFYSLIALAIDYDSFSKFGGNPFLERAYNITILAGNSIGSSWVQSADTRGRYWLIENLRSQQFNNFREGFYKYHRLILDDFGRVSASGRKQILEYLETIKTVSTMKQGSVLINSFFDAKSEELINIFSEATKQEKEEAFALLLNLDPDKTENYRKILK